LNLTNLGWLELHYNQITDISSLSGLTKLTYLNLFNNPLNTAAYCVYLPLIEENNPGIFLIFDAVETFACDCDGDGFVDYFDLMLLTNHWLKANCKELDCEGADLTGDNKVDLDDFAFLARHWLGEWKSIE